MTQRPLATATAAALTVALLLLSPAAPVGARPDEELDVVLGWRRPAVGAEVAMRSRQKLAVSVEVLMQEQPVHTEDQDRTYEFVMTSVVTAVDGSKVTAEKRTFTTARQADGGDPFDLDLAGRTVIATRRGDGRDYRYEDGGPIAPRELEALGEAFDDDADDDGPHVFDPGRRVGVGDSWKPDLERIARNFFGDELPPDAPLPVDLDAARGKLTLVRAERREGAAFGVIEGEILLPVIQLGPLTLKEPVPCKMTVRFEGCLDGSRPDAAFLAEVSMRGVRSIEGPGGEPLTVDIDVQVRAEGSAELKRVDATAGAPKKTRRLY